MTKTMMIGLATALVSLSACQPATKTAAPVATPAVVAAPAAPAFTIGVLEDKDLGSIQGCMTMLGRAGVKPDNNIFVEDAVDTAAKGFMKINDQLVPVALQSQTQADKGGLRLFKSADGKLTIAENYVTGAAHEESDSVELTGTLTVTWNGASQSIKVEGGTAC